MDPSSIFSYLQDHVKRQVLNFMVTMPFWVIPFLLFKPTVFDLPIYVQISLIFCLAVIWYVMSVVSTIYFQITFFSKSKTLEYFLPELVSLHSIFFIAVFVLIGYYYSFCVTDFLLLSFSSIAALILLFIVFTYINDYFKNGNE